MPNPLFPPYQSSSFAVYQSQPCSLPVATLGLFPPDVGSLGGTVSDEYERTSQTLADPGTGKLVRVDHIWTSGAAPGTLPTVEAYNADGTPYTGSISALVFP